MREPGRLLLSLIQTLGLRRLRATVIEPAVADMQHEYGEEKSRGLRIWSLARGYLSILAGASLYAALLPARHFRENWSGRDASGLRLLRQAWRPTAVAAAVFIGLPFVTSPIFSRGWLGIDVMFLLLPSFMMSGAAVTLPMGLGFVLARDRSGARAAVVMGLVAATLSFAFFELAVTQANRAYRVAAYEALTGRSAATLRAGSREMTLRELEAATALASAEACPTQTPMSSCGGAPSRSFLRVEWHNRLSIPALGFSFMLAAVALSRIGRRVAVVVGLWLTYGAAFGILQFAESRASQGELPVVLAAWGPHLVPLTLAALLFGFGDRFITASPMRLRSSASE